MTTRRDFLRLATAGTSLALLPGLAPSARAAVTVNDIHSQLNATQVDRVLAIDSEAGLRTAIAAARRDGKPICIAGGRHAMGGQQFATGGVLLDTRPMKKIISLDAERGIVE